MRKFIFMVAMIPFISSNAMEQVSLTKQSDHEKIKVAIINGQSDECKLLLRTIDPTICIENDMCCLSFALAKNSSVATKLAKEISLRMMELETVLIEPFQVVASMGSIELLDSLMKLKMNCHVKKSGCALALSIACGNNCFPFVNKLINSYGNYIKNPCWDASFERAAICFPQESEKVIQTILKHPRAVKNLTKIITLQAFNYPEKKDQYYKLLKRAQSLQSVNVQ